MSRLLPLKHASWLAAATLLAFSQLSSASPITCGVNTTHDATANGAYADDCDYYSATNIANPTDITNHTNSLWGGMDGDFTYVGKYNNGTGSEIGMAGFELTVGPGDMDYAFSYQLSVPGAYVGTTVDWVLGVKQANNSYMSYLFEGVVLGIDGGFNNFWLNPRDKEVNDYSFVAGFIREVATVPETGTFLLMLTGLLGLAITRRRTRKSA